MSEVKILVVSVEVPKGVNVILGQSHFIKSVEDIYEAIVNSVPTARFGLAFCEASGDRLVRVEGNEEELKKLAAQTALKVGAGHFFIVYLRDAWPINVLNSIKQVPEVVTLYCATSNPVQVLVAETDQGRAVIGVIDGYKPLGVEDESKIRERVEFLRRIGYKRGL
ncbi:MAG TPA: adenosine monophosphate-protein transferase [Thermofilaceae archaeon]|nr:adenosine monophosphate-protein transferase [Thermofilaceae archaeon]